MDTSRAPFAQHVGKPFVPDESVDPELRVVTALEYIAAQLGAIAESVARIDARLERQDPTRRQHELTSEGAPLDIFSHHSE